MIARNLPELFIKQAKKKGRKTIFEYRLRRNEPYRTVSWRHLNTNIKAIAYGLIELGLKKGDNIAILSDTRYEWAACDFAILSAGGVVVPIYPSLPEEAVAYILNNSNCEIVILENKGQLQKIRSQWSKLSRVRYAIVIEDLGDLPRDDPRILSLRDLKDKGKLNFSKDPYLISARLRDIDINDVATIIYTSGTTGPPKGVELTHKNILSVLEVLPPKLPLNSSDKFLSFLPLSHVFERVAGLYYAIFTGTTTCFCSHAEQIPNALKDSKATVMLVVPRLLEKIYAKINKQIDNLSGTSKTLFTWAYEIGKKYFVTGNSLDKASYFLADKIVFSAIRKKLAPKLRGFISGGAPLSCDIAEFFYIIGIPILEGYGLTETTAPASVNSFKDFKIGTVGKPLNCAQIKISNDGEILIKGPSVFNRYYQNENATREAFDNGWFKSGDIGFIDEDGFLKITDRKKDIIVNSAGKNIAPQNIENSIKTSPYISNVIVVGDKRKYLSALVTLDTSAVVDYLKSHNLSFDVSKLSEIPQIKKLLDEEIKLKTAAFADYEQIRRFTILPNDFTIESGEITPTLKVKRRFVQEKYKTIIDIMYPIVLLFFCFFFPLGVLSYEGEQKFEEEVVQNINEERSFKGLLPLTKDDIAMKVAFDHSQDLINKEVLSYYNNLKQGPDERYSICGGTGATIELVKGFEGEKIQTTILLAKQLVEALKANEDDSQILFNPYITHLGFGSARSVEGKKFVAVIEFITKGGQFEPLQLSVNSGEKISLSGKVNKPFKFKAISIAYLNDNSISFDEEDLKPYFPPQDFIAFGDTAKSNFLKVIKGIGVLGAIAGAPFTGGATAILAPAILSSIQNGQPREIPLKSGIKVNSKGEFKGKIELNYQGLSGLYFVSVLGELPSVNFPVVISRRTVRVNPIKISKSGNEVKN